MTILPDMKHNSLLHEQLKKVSPEVKMEMDLSAAMVEKIESLLASKGMTHRELAKRIGCDESQIIRWTRGFPNFTFNALARISCALEEPLIDTSFYISGPCSGVRGYSFESERVHSLNEPVTEKYRSHQPHQYYRHFRNGKLYRFVTFATMNASMALITGQGHALLNFVIAMMDGVVGRIVLSLVLAYVFDFGLYGLFWGNARAGFISVIWGDIYYFSGRWKRRKALVG